MSTDFHGKQPTVIEPDLESDINEDIGAGVHALPPWRSPGRGLPAPADLPRPVNWNALTSDEAETEWLDLNAWVDWLRATYGLPPTVVPPYWHRHDELVWELSALHVHWLGCFDPDGSPSGPLAWHRDFADARHRLREWVSTCGTRVDRDRATRQTAWPGEDPPPTRPELVIEDRASDFVHFVLEDVAARRRVEERARSVSSA